MGHVSTRNWDQPEHRPYAIAAIDGAESRVAAGREWNRRRSNSAGLVGASDDRKGKDGQNRRISVVHEPLKRAAGESEHFGTPSRDPAHCTLRWRTSM